MKGFAEVNDVRLHYEAAGTGQTVAFVHGHFLDSRMWDRAFKAVSQRFRAVRFDLRGHGRTEMPVRPYSHARDLLGLLDYLGTERACVVGHALGASVAVEFAVQNPSRVSGLVLVSPYLRGHASSAAYRKRLERFNDVARQHGPARARRIWLERDELLEGVRKNTELHARVATIAGAYKFTEALHPPLEQVTEAASHRLGEIAAPALIVVGERDAVDIRATGRALHGGISNARTTIIPEACHWPNLEQPEAFNWALTDFLNRFAAPQ